MVDWSLGTMKINCRRHPIKKSFEHYYFIDRGLFEFSECERRCDLRTTPRTRRRNKCSCCFSFSASLIEPAACPDKAYFLPKIRLSASKYEPSETSVSQFSASRFNFVRFVKGQYISKTLLWIHVIFAIISRIAKLHTDLGLLEPRWLGLA